jgi:GNAT superfamily N-acetyltransferase
MTSDAPHCTVYIDGEIPTLPGERLGSIGQYEAPDPTAGKAALDDACAQLAAKGCTLAVGPMDGNTWRRYRFVTGGDTTEPPFFLEPTNPAEYPFHWLAAGFTPLAEYTSALTEDLTLTDPRIARLFERLAAQGMTLRPVDIAHADEDLHAIYELSLTSFRRNFLYTPLAETEFLQQYRRILPYVRPDLTVMAHAADGTLAGFLFALPDLHEAQRGEPLRTVIVKTVAILPGREWAGLGLLLLDTCHKAARAAGFSRAIHALMHESNASRNVSGAYAGRTMRRYTLYARRLAPPISAAP